MRSRPDRTRAALATCALCLTIVGLSAIAGRFPGGLLLAAFDASGQGVGPGPGQSPGFPPIVRPVPQIDPYGVSVSDSRTVNIGAAEVTSTVVPPGTNRNCLSGRLLISNDNVKTPGQVVSLPLDNLNAGLTFATFNSLPVGWGETESRRIKSNDHDLVALPNGTVLLVKMGQSRRPLNPKPVWFDYAYKLGDAWGPGARSEIFIWRSVDCGMTFDYVSSIDTATIDDAHGTLQDWSGGLPQHPALHPLLPIWQMGGTDGPLTRVDPETGDVYVTIKLVGYLPTATDPLILGSQPLNRTIVMMSSDGGSSWDRAAVVMRGVWRFDVVPRANGLLAFADNGQKPAADGGGYAAYVIPACQVGCIVDPGVSNAAFEAPEPQGAYGWDQSPWNHPLLYNADGDPSNDDPTDYMDTNVAGQTVLTRSPSSQRLLLAYMDTIENGRGDGYRLYMYDGSSSWLAFEPIAPRVANPDNFVLHVTPVDPGHGPLLFYWYDVNTASNAATIRGRLVTRDHHETINFAVKRSGGGQQTFDVTANARWYGDYHTAGGYATGPETFWSSNTYHYYPVWVEPDGKVHFAHVKYQMPFTIAPVVADLLGYHIPSGGDRMIYRQDIDVTRLAPEPSIEEEDFRIRIR